MSALKEVFVVVVVVLSIHLLGVLSQDNHAHGNPTHGNRHAHEHHKKVAVKSETYVIGIHFNTTAGNQLPIPTWNITDEDRKMDDKINIIATAMGIWAHGITTPAALTGTGFQGLSIDHYENGKYIHTFALPKCTKPRLGQAIIGRTAGNALSSSDKKTLMDAITACRETVKTQTQKT